MTSHPRRYISLSFITATRLSRPRTLWNAFWADTLPSTTPNGGQSQLCRRGGLLVTPTILSDPHSGCVIVNNPPLEIIKSLHHGKKLVTRPVLNSLSMRWQLSLALNSASVPLLGLFSVSQIPNSRKDGTATCMPKAWSWRQCRAVRIDTKIPNLFYQKSTNRIILQKQLISILVNALNCLQTYLE